MKRKMLTRLLSFVLVISMVMSFTVMPAGATDGEGSEPHSHTWVNGVCSDTTCNTTCTHEGTGTTENVTASTCLAAGTKTITCVCGTVISTETLSLADHVYNEETGRCTADGCTAVKPAAQVEAQPASCTKTTECDAEAHETDCPKHPDYKAPAVCDKTSECGAETHETDCPKHPDYKAPAVCAKTSECGAETHETDCPKHPDYVAPVVCDKTAECKAAENHDAECLKAIADAEKAVADKAKVDEINALIDALPETVTAENYESVMTQLSVIMARQESMGELWAQTNQEKLQAVIAMTQVGAPTPEVTPTGTLSSSLVNLTDPAETYLSATITNLSATQSVVIKLFSGTTQIATTTLLKSEYYNHSELSVKIILTGNSSSWKTDWAAKMPRADMVPTTMELWVDDTYMNTANVPMMKTSGEQAVNWAEVPGVAPAPAGTTSVGYTIDSANATSSARIWGEASGVNAKESVIIALYSGNTLLAESYLDDPNKELLNGIPKGITWSVYTTTRNYDYWNTTWKTDGAVWNVVPDKVKLYVDGEFVAENGIQQNSSDNLKSFAWWQLDNVQGAPVVVTNASGEVSKFGNLTDAVAACAGGETITLNEDQMLTATVTIDKAVTLDLNTFTITGASSEIALEIKADATIKNGTITGSKSGTSSGVIDIYANLNLNGVTVTTSKIRALAFKDGPVTAELTSCNITGSFKGYGGSVWKINSGTYTYSSTAIREQLNGDARISGGIFHYEIKTEHCAPGYTVKNIGDGTYTVEQLPPVCFVDANGNMQLDEGERNYPTLDNLFADDLSGNVTVVLMENVSTENQVNVSYSKNVKYHFVTPGSAATITFAYADDWNKLSHFSIAENITMNVPYLQVTGPDVDIYGTLNAGYPYFYGTGAGVTVHSGGKLTVSGNDPTIQVKGGTVMTVNGTVDCGTLNVWTQDSNDSKLIVSGANASVTAAHIHAWEGSSQKIEVTNGATLTATNFQADRGAEVTVDAATLNTGNISLGYDNNVGTMNVVNGGKVTSGGAINISKNSVVNTSVDCAISGATLTGAGTINIDAAKYTRDVDVITADTTGFTGTISAANCPAVSDGAVGAFKSDTKIVVKKIAFPSADVTTDLTKLDGNKPQDLTFGAKFTISENTSAEQIEFFKDWEVDFVLTIDQTIPPMKGAASGYYATFCQNGEWIQYGPFDDEIPAGSYKIMGLVLNGHGLPFSMISGDVKSFSCGLIIDEKANPGLRATLELRMYDPAMMNEDGSWPESYTGITIEKREYEADYDASIKETGKRFATVQAAVDAANAAADGGTVIIKDGAALPAELTLDGNVAITYKGNTIRMHDGGKVTFGSDGSAAYKPEINTSNGYGTVVVTNSTGSTTYFVQQGSTITAYTSGVVSNPTGEYMQEKTHDYKPNYTITDVDNKGTTAKNDNVFYVNTSADMMFKCDGFYSNFVKAWVVTKEGKTIDLTLDTDYTKKDGCTELTLKNTFLRKLSAGDYTLVMQYKDGETAKANFFVRDIVYEADPTNPKTGDTIFTPVMLMLFSASALAVLLLNKKRVF